MGYYLRYISVDDQQISLSLLEHELRKIDEQYVIERVQGAIPESGDLKYNNQLYGQIETNQPGDTLFEEELEELKEFVEAEEGDNKEIVLQMLQ